MGWKENGKYGVTTGRTVRSSFASRWHSKAPQESELLLKFTRGTEGLSSFELEEFLTQNDIEDGLADFTESTTRLVRAQGVDRSSKVPYSLKKRKRWLLSENANATLSDPVDAAETAPHVTFIHRRVQGKTEADCFAVEKTRECEVFRPRKRKYTKVQDLLKKCDKTELDPQVCYEISYRYPTNEYPLCAEIRGRYLPRDLDWYTSNPRKARWKNKGAKNKGHRWGLYRDAEVRSGQIANEGPFLRKQSHLVIDSKVQVMDARQFSRCNIAKERSRFFDGYSLGSYIVESSKNPKSCSKKRHSRRGLGCSTENQLLNAGFKYGKKSVVYVDPEPGSNLSHDQCSAITTTTAPRPDILLPEKKVVSTLLLHAEDVKPLNLKADWRNLYSEANSFPRKFTIDVGPLLSDETNLTIESCHVLFQVTRNITNGMSYAVADVSLHITLTDDLGASISDATAKFYSDINTNRQEIWRVSDVLDITVVCMQDFFQSLQPPTKSPSDQKHKTWNSVGVLGSMFGWKSEVFTQSEMKSELRKKITKAQETQFKNDFDRYHYNKHDDAKVMEFQEVSCGICCEELGECFLKEHEKFHDRVILPSVTQAYLEKENPSFPSESQTIVCT